MAITALYPPLPYLPIVVSVAFLFLFPSLKNLPMLSRSLKPILELSDISIYGLDISGQFSTYLIVIWSASPQPIILSVISRTPVLILGPSLMISSKRDSTVSS